MMTSNPSIWRPWHRRLWSGLNASTAPVWLIMILAPRARLTRRLVAAHAPLHLVLGVAYAALLVRGIGNRSGRVNFFDGASVARGLSIPEGMLAGWTHYLTFDLMVGAWIWQTAIDEDINPRLALLATWWAGPIGPTLFAVQRRRSDRRALRQANFR